MKMSLTTPSFLTRHDLSSARVSIAWTRRSAVAQADAYITAYNAC